jgi:hypothetical protein
VVAATPRGWCCRDLLSIGDARSYSGRSLAQAVSEELGNLHEHATGSPNYNDLSQFGRADGGITTE